MNDEMVIATMRCDACSIPDLVLLTAAVSSIVLGGQETTAGALSRLLCLMAENPDLQQRLRDVLVAARAVRCAAFLVTFIRIIDIFQNKGDEELDYYELNDLPLLDGVCREALRLFAPVTCVWRQCVLFASTPCRYLIHTPQDVRGRGRTAPVPHRRPEDGRGDARAADHEGHTRLRWHGRGESVGGDLGRGCGRAQAGAVDGEDDQ